MLLYSAVQCNSYCTRVHIRVLVLFIRVQFEWRGGGNMSRKSLSCCLLFNYGLTSSAIAVRISIRSFGASFDLIRASFASLPAGMRHTIQYSNESYEYFKFF